MTITTDDDVIHTTPYRRRHFSIAGILTCLLELTAFDRFGRGHKKARWSPKAQPTH